MGDPKNVILTLPNVAMLVRTNDLNSQLILILILKLMLWKPHGLS